MIRYYGCDAEVAPYLQDVVHDAVDGFLDLLVRDDVDIVKDADGFLELLGIQGVLPEIVVYLEPLRFDLVQGLNWKKVGLPILVLLLVFLEVHARIGGLPTA